MSYPVFYPIEGDVLPIFFDSYDGGTGASITMSGLAVTDIEIYKDGSVTQRASDAGYVLLDTDGIDFDAITGIHGFSIDLNDNTDAGFFTVGPWYHVVVSAVTIDAQTVNFVAAAFRIVSATRGLAGTALPNAAADAAFGLPISDAGGLDLDAKLANTNEVTAARMGALTDLIDGGRLDLLVDAILNRIGGFTGSGANNILGVLRNIARTDATLATDLAGTYAPTTDSLQANRANIGTAGVGLTAADDAMITAIADVPTVAEFEARTIVAASYSTVTTAQVNAEVLDVMNVDTHVEPGQGAPAATASIFAKINYLYKAWRNKKTQTSTQYSLLNDDAVTVDQKATVSDDGTTTTVGEVATGP